MFLVPQKMSSNSTWRNQILTQLSRKGGQEDQRSNIRSGEEGQSNSLHGLCCLLPTTEFEPWDSERIKILHQFSRSISFHFLPWDLESLLFVFITSSSPDINLAFEFACARVCLPLPSMSG